MSLGYQLYPLSHTGMVIGMVGVYDFKLVALSILIAVFASFTVFHLVGRISHVYGIARKGLLVSSAVAMGGGIWSMHFVAMLAFSLPIQVRYDVLITLISLLVAIVMTGIGLFIVSYARLRISKVLTGGIFMGLGIASMHYIGMAAMRMQATMSYNPWLVALSIMIGIAVSIAALWLPFRLRDVWKKAASAFVMGGAISGMHYTAMAATSFMYSDIAIMHDSPAISPPLFAIIIAAVTFIYLIFALLSALPDDTNRQNQAPSSRIQKIPILENKHVVLLDLDNVIHLQADGHYTMVFTHNEKKFCNLSLSDLEHRLDPQHFIRVHPQPYY